MNKKKRKLIIIKIGEAIFKKNPVKLEVFFRKINILKNGAKFIIFLINKLR